MSRQQYGEACLPVTTIQMDANLTAQTPEPTHVACPGGSHRELAVIGGWTCPCACHLTGGSPAGTIKAADGNAPSSSGDGDA